MRKMFKRQDLSGLQHHEETLEEKEKRIPRDDKSLG
jgi:hypothetical protein